MPVAAAIVGAAVVGAGTTIAMSNKAAKAQGKAAEDAKAVAESTFEKQAKLNEPFRQGGITAQNRIMELLGLGPRPAPANAPTTNAFAAGAAPTYAPTTTSAYTPANYSAPIAAYGDGNMVSDIGLISGARENGVPNYEVFGNYTPIIAPSAENATMNAPEAVNTMAAPSDAAPESDYGKYARDFSMKDFEADPGYAFRMSEGMKALERSAAARGGLLSGSALKGIQRFGQDLASTEYTNAFNRYQVNRGNQLNPLFSLMGAGQNATNTVTNAAGNAGANEAAAITNAGAARASGYVAAGNAINQGLSSVAGYFANQPLNNAMIGYYNRGAASSTPATGGSFGGGGILNRGYITPYAPGN